MKKVLSILLSVLCILSFCAVFSSAEKSIRVTVTIYDKNGNIAVGSREIGVTDIDKDGKFTLHDALFCAHEALYKGGAKAGYSGVSLPGYSGISLMKLWGTENGGSYSYYINNRSATSLADTVKNGDYVCAFIYTDLENYSDTYTYFDVQTVDTACYQTITLTMYKLSFDKNWNTVKAPVKNAVITVDGKKTPFVTSDDGKVSFAVTSVGSHVVSAVTKGESSLITPCCRVNAKPGNIFNALIYLFKAAFAFAKNFSKVR